MHKQPVDVAAADEALKFFAWAYDNGADDGRRSSTISRCPTTSSRMIKKTWAKEIKAADGKPVFDGNRPPEQARLGGAIPAHPQ